MDIRITKSWPFGYFSFDELTFNRTLAEKHAYLIAFKPGWLDHTGSTPIASSLFAVSPLYSITLKRGPGNRRSALVHPPHLIAALPSHELTFSEEFSSTVGVIRESLSQSCGPAGIPVAVSAMLHVLQTAETFDERERAGSSCLGARRHINEMTHSEKATSKLWPFDCRNLAFAKPPSKEALALERALREQRRHSRENLTPTSLSTRSIEDKKPVH